MENKSSTLWLDTSTQKHITKDQMKKICMETHGEDAESALDTMQEALDYDGVLILEDEREFIAPITTYNIINKAEHSEVTDAQKEYLACQLDKINEQLGELIRSLDKLEIDPLHMFGPTVHLGSVDNHSYHLVIGSDE
jgi:hypothetical protein